MSSGDDSETAEWEREQMLRGAQMKRRKNDQPKVEKSNTDVINILAAKEHVSRDIERIESIIKSIKHNIGSTTLEVAKSEKRLNAIRKHLEKLRSLSPKIEAISKLGDPNEILTYLQENKQIFSQMPSDQKEMIDSLEAKLLNSLSKMEVDEDN